MLLIWYSGNGACIEVRGRLTLLLHSIPPDISVNFYQFLYLFKGCSVKIEGVRYLCIAVYCKRQMSVGQIAAKVVLIGVTDSFDNSFVCVVRLSITDSVSQVTGKLSISSNV